PSSRSLAGSPAGHRRSRFSGGMVQCPCPVISTLCPACPSGATTFSWMMTPTLWSHQEPGSLHTTRSPTAKAPMSAPLLLLKPPEPRLPAHFLEPVLQRPRPHGAGLAAVRHQGLQRGLVDAAAHDLVEAALVVLPALAGLGAVLELCLDQPDVLVA